MTYRDDPGWQDAEAEYVRATGDDETATDAFVRRIDATQRMFDIESRYEAAA